MFDLASLIIFGKLLLDLSFQSEDAIGATKLTVQDRKQNKVEVRSRREGGP